MQFSSTIFDPVITDATDYFPFGAPNRTVSSTAGYRYGFNGKELDKNNEFGTANVYDYGFRIYNPSIGRFLSVDPLTRSYPELTPYQFASNSPIQFIDLDGLEKATPDEQLRAFEMIRKFSGDNLNISSWTKIPRESFARDLMYMVANSWSINQENTNLCGPALACKIAIDHDPESFVSNAINLYKFGEIKPMKLGTSSISANPALLNNSPTNDLSSAEYIIMTSIRHSFNYLLSYDPTNDNGASGFTWPEDISKFVVGYHNISMVTPPTKGEFGEPLSIAGQTSWGLNKGYSVGALVDAGHFIYNDPPSAQAYFGDHFIQINELQWNSKSKITARYWTWGQNPNDQPPFKNSLADFLSAVKAINLFW
jgi:RHS repeat-associated protein